MVTTSPRWRKELAPETLQGKTAQLTVGGCLLVASLAFMAFSWDEISCVAGEMTSTGPCGIQVTTAAAIFWTGVACAVVGAGVVLRGLRRPVSPDGGSGWRVGQGIFVAACGLVLGIMIPRYECPPGSKLSAVFQYCVSAERAYQAPSPGLPWKFAAAGAGIVLGIVLARWRSLPWPVSSVVTVLAFLFVLGFTLHRAAIGPL
jgi:hypothetical protein